ncbi:MAG: hypothetical protein K2N14_00530 [Clostridia bacterium]|nr:hypothetical protein [Clostridia bacterium]
MNKTKTKKLLALLAVGAVMTTAAAGVAMSKTIQSSTAFAYAAEEDETPALEGSLKNPEAVKIGENKITKMIVNENKMLNYKELVYYMSFTPSQTGVYSFTHSNSDVGIVEIYSQNETASGEWDNTFSVYSAELSSEDTYTIVINYLDWSIDLENKEANTYYTLETPATITVAYQGVKAGRTKDNALDYTVGETIFVDDNKPVWYTFTAATNTNYYVISFGADTIVYNVDRDGNMETKASVSSEFDSFSGRNTFYIYVTPEAGNYAQVQILNASEQPAGSCIANALELPENGVVGGGKWYTYTVGDEDVTVSLTPVDNAYHVHKEYKDEDGNVMWTDDYTLVGSVSVYERCVLIDTLFDGASITLEKGKTYQFYAPEDIYEDWDDPEFEPINVESKLIIG